MYRPYPGTESSGYGPQGERLVSGIVPLSADRKKVLLVQSKTKKGWVFPKGGWETDEPTSEEAAKREAWEEAGIEVDIIRSLGVIVDKEGKPSKHAQGNGGDSKQPPLPSSETDGLSSGGPSATDLTKSAELEICSKTFHQPKSSFEFFEAFVNKELDEYPEMRPRRWCTYDETLELLRKRPELIEALNRCSVERSEV